MAAIEQTVDVPEDLKLDNKEYVAKMTSGFSFREEITPTMRIESELLSISYNTNSEFQRVQIIETADFGKTLVLDGKTQSAAKDEYAYHECLVQPPMLAVGWALSANGADNKAKRAYIGGGGELATARELLKHPSIEEVVMVDLDKVVCDTSREFLPEWNAGSTEDPRLKLHYTDAFAWLNRDDELTGKFDIIVMDICDPIEAGPGIVLYTKEYYELAQKKLNPGGVLVTQSGPGGILGHEECFTTINNTLETVFDHVLPYTTEIPSFGSAWAFNLAFDSENKTAGDSFREMPIKDINARLTERVPGHETKLKYYDGLSHHGVFGLNKQIRANIEKETRVITRETPVFMSSGTETVQKS
jgi:spermidine synthase